MAELLDLPIALQQLARISVEDYHRIGELGIYGKRTELIRGIVIEKTPVSPLHFTVSQRVHEHLLGLKVPGVTVRHEGPLTLSDSEPLPDIAVVAGTRADFSDRHPATAELVIEVAVTSEALDREMAPLYAEAGVKEYWIVLAARKQVEVYRRPENGVYREMRLYAGDEELVCAAVRAIRVHLRELFA